MNRQAVPPRLGRRVGRGAGRPVGGRGRRGDRRRAGVRELRGLRRAPAQGLLRQGARRQAVHRRPRGRAASGPLGREQHAKALARPARRRGRHRPARGGLRVRLAAANAFATAAATVRTGLTVLRPLLGAYQTAAASVAVPDYRILYASLAASIGQQIGALSALSAPWAPSRFPSPSTSRPRAPRSSRTWARRVE